VSLVDKNPTNEFAAAALNNAAVAFEKSRFFDSAMKTFERIFAEYPKSEFTENALFRVAYNAERFYDYDKAIQRFQDLARNYPQGENASNATYNAARLLEQTQRYAQAATAFIDFANQFPENKDAAKAYFRAAKNYQRMGDWKNQIKIYEGFKAKYGKNSENNKLVIEGIYETIAIFKKQGDKKKINALYVEMIKEYDQRGLPAGSYEASFPAEAMFHLVEPRFERFAAMKIKGNMKQQGQIINDMKKEIAGLTDDYSKILKYKALGWNIASFYRIGLLRQLFAQALYEIPIPENLTDEMRDIYTTQIEDIAIPIEDEAVKRFEEAYERAKEFRISNEWTQKILQSLNKYKPAEYPTFKTEKRMTFKQFVTNAYIALPKEAQKLDIPEVAPSEVGEKKAKQPAPNPAPQESSPQDQSPEQKPATDPNQSKPTNTEPEKKSDSVEDVTL
jgi:TolA-binding protein